MCRLGSSPEHLEHAGPTLTGILVHGSVGIVLDVVAAADENAAAVKKLEPIVGSILEDTVPAPAGAASVPRDGLQVSMTGQVTWMTSHLI